MSEAFFDYFFPFNLMVEGRRGVFFNVLFPPGVIRFAQLLYIQSAFEIQMISFSLHNFFLFQSESLPVSRVVPHSSFGEVISENRVNRFNKPFRFQHFPRKIFDIIELRTCDRHCSARVKNTFPYKKKNDAIRTITGTHCLIGHLLISVFLSSFIICMS